LGALENSLQGNLLCQIGGFLAACSGGAAGFFVPKKYCRPYTGVGSFYSGRPVVNIMIAMLRSVSAISAMRFIIMLLFDSEANVRRYCRPDRVFRLG